MCIRDSDRGHPAAVSMRVDTLIDESRDDAVGGAPASDRTPSTCQPFVIASECPWPARNGVTAKSASLLDGWEVEPLVLCPEHPFGPRSSHRVATPGPTRRP